MNALAPSRSSSPSPSHLDVGKIKPYLAIVAAFVVTALLAAAVAVSTPADTSPEADPTPWIAG